MHDVIVATERTERFSDLHVCDRIEEVLDVEVKQPALTQMLTGVLHVRRAGHKRCHKVAKSRLLAQGLVETRLNLREAPRA
jgi:hypothetical protein